VATRKKTAQSGAKKRGARKASAAASETVPDPREPVVITPASLNATLAEIEAVLANLTPPEEPRPSDLVDALVHALFAAGLPCGYGQVARRRLHEEYVDRNELRLAEAYETAEVLADLDIPDLFERCRVVQDAIHQIYADQNRVSLDELREASASERKSFFQRVPAVPQSAARFLTDLLNWEEVALSPRSTQRVQQRLGLDPKDKAVEAFVARLRELIAPFGHVPLDVGPDDPKGRPRTEPPLSPACLLARLTPKK